MLLAADYRGCFADDDADDRELKGKVNMKMNNNSGRNCAKYCIGYKYAATQVRCPVMKNAS